MSSSKELFLKKIQESQAAEQSDKKIIESAKEEYRQRVFALGKQIEEWLLGMPVKISNVSKILHDSTGFNSDVGRYEINFITITNGDKKVTFYPEGLLFHGATGLVSVVVDNPNRAPRTQRFSLFMRYASMKDAKGWVLAKGGDYNDEAKVLDEELFFNLISSIA